MAVKCGNQTALLYVSKFRNGNQSIHLAHSNQSFTPEEFTQTHNPNPMTRPDPWYDYVNWAGASIGRHRRRGQLPVHTISCKCDWCRFAMGYMRRSSSSKWVQAAATTPTSTPAFLGEEKRPVGEEKRPQNEEKRNKVDKVSLTKHFRQFVTVDELLEAYRVLETMEVDMMDSGEDFQEDDADDEDDFEEFSLGPQAEEAIACLDSLEMEAERFFRREFFFSIDL